MENTQTETTTHTTTATEAPVHQTQAVDTKPEAVKAPETTQAQTKQPNEVKKPLGPQDFFKQREDKREKKAIERVAELEKKLAEFEASRTKPVQAEQPKPSLLDDPEKWAADVTATAEKRALEAIERRTAEAQAVTAYQKAAEGAYEWLLTRSHLKEDPNLGDEIAKTINEKYAHLAHFDGGKDPSAAAKLAYLDVCAAKGIAPDMDGFKSFGMDATKGRANSGKSPSPSAEGKRVFVGNEAEKYVLSAKPGTKEYRARLAEIEEAKKEGRIK